jgi:hypothetical protein
MSYDWFAEELKTITERRNKNRMKRMQRETRLIDFKNKAKEASRLCRRKNVIALKGNQKYNG